MAWTQADLDELNKAIASGASSVSYRDRTVVYQTRKEMMETRSLMMSEIAPPVSSEDRVQRVSFAKGYQ